MYSVVLANGEEAKVKEIPTHAITEANNAILPLRKQKPWLIIKIIMCILLLIVRVDNA